MRLEGQRVEDLELERLLARCGTDPIHNPGAIQPHGALVVLDAGRSVVAGSANLEAIVGTSIADALGQPIGTALGQVWADVLDQAISTEQAVVEEGGIRLTCSAEHAADLILLEVEVDPGDNLDDDWKLHRTMEGLMGAPDAEALVQRVVATIADLTGFDRVMCYRFDPDWHGEVIAERVNEGIDSFDGLRFPATDIPPQARAQYERTPLRLIPDSGATPVPLIAVSTVDLEALDLSDARLRAVSPIHLRYLQNLGVRSSMSVSLTVEGRLWGIIACHHVAGPLQPSRRVRTVVDLVARTASMLLTVLEAGRATQHRLDLLRRLDELAAPLVRADDRSPLDVLVDQGDALLELVGAAGVTLLTGAGAVEIGTVAPLAVTEDLAARAVQSEGALASDELRALDPSWAVHAKDASGALVVPIGATGGRAIAWFRPEVVETVRWAGDPASKVVDHDADGGAQLGPRASFATYAEVVRGRSAPWSEHEAEVAEELGLRLAAAEALQAERDARLAAQLQQTLLLEAFPSITGVVGAAEYRPASNSPLGGDWYDVFYLPSNRSIVALGDVAGHGLEVAAVMAQLRHALRAYLVRAPSPAEALARLNHLTRTLLPTEMATAVLVELDLPGRCLRIANAGHLPPVILGTNGARLAEQRGMALGLATGISYELAEEPVEPGERLVLYSDGLIERRTRTLDESVAELVEAAAATRHLTVAEQSAALADRLTDGTDVVDDVTVVVVEIADTRGDPPT
ncbi:MAG: SpoIIE family protein phosphatase [Aquihabitans sp.]